MVILVVLVVLGVVLVVLDLSWRSWTFTEASEVWVRVDWMPLRSGRKAVPTPFNPTNELIKTSFA